MDYKIEKTATIYAVLDHGGNILYISANASAIMKQSSKEITGGHLTDFVHNEDLGALKTYLHHQHHMYPCTFRLKTGDSVYIWMEASMDYIHTGPGENSSGEIVLKMAPCELDHEPAYNPSLLNDGSESAYLDQMPVPLLIMENGTIQYANREAAGLLHANEAELIGLDALQLIGDEYKEIFRDRIERLRHGGKTGAAEQTWRRLDGTPIELEVKSSSTVFQHKNSELIVLLDISARKRFQRVLQKSRERYQRLVQNSLDTIAVIHSSKWVFINESGVKMFKAAGYQDMLGKGFTQFMDGDQQQHAMEMLERVLKGITDSEVGEISWRTYENQRIYTEMVCIPTSYFGEPAVQVILRDLSEKKKTEELILRSEKLSVAGQLAAGIAHEIRNPLTAIKGFLQLMKTKENQNEQYFEIIFGELNRIELILSELLVLAKPQASVFVKTDMKKLILEVTTLLETQANLKGVYIENRHEREEAILHGDPNQLKQVFINLIKNAIDAMPNGGKVIISSFFEEEEVIIKVQDEGEGIPESVLTKMGDPFFTTKEKGTGLGLMITYNIIENHSGKVSLISEPGTGTTFTLAFPIKKGRPQR
ncbi:PAS domain S-box protein [Bacillus mangrovi]|uniref:histidine kinase n=1 Tax=Metabacillus mangrovi TaxID=1491830 RepID=A0A7X2S4J2_9BACI|nr:PAS domain S-box protein [Metabacillus mangrovi]MTH53125.1 PAS domain S-box protein [Metabacillus mangrovi]